MLRVFLGIGVVLAVASGHHAALAGPPLDRARVEAFADGTVRGAMRTRQVAGATVAIVDRSGVVMTRGYGVASLSPRTAVDADTLFRVGSISKTVVWIALMQLVEQGKISLDDPINDRLPPELRIPDEGFREPIRVRHLMTHSAGFEDSLLEGVFVLDPARLLPLDQYLRTHRVHRVREAGTLAVYSNYGAALAGALVAHVAAQPWQDYAEQHVLRPLGMATATFREPYPAPLAQARGLADPMPEGVAAKVTHGFSYGAGEFTAHPFEYLSDIAPAGSMSASANDMALYMRALLDPALMEKAGVLRTDTALAMRNGLFGNTPELGSWRYGFVDYSALRGHGDFGHDGATMFQHSNMEIYLDLGLAIFVSVNTPNGVPLLGRLPNTLLDEFAGEADATPPPIANPEAEANKVAGTYRSLRLASYRSERPLLRFVASVEVRALPGGDILVGQTRYSPIGEGVFAQTEEAFAQIQDHGRIAFHEAGGRMRLYDSLSAAPADRIGFFEQLGWLEMIAALAAFAVTWSIVAAIRRIIAGRRHGRAASVVLDGLCLIWLAGFVLFYLAVWPWLADQNTTVFSYPGTLFPLACWVLLIAALATPLAGAAALGPLRPKDWNRWRWIQQGVTLAVFAGLGLTLFNWGLLGYSGW